MIMLIVKNLFNWCLALNFWPMYKSRVIFLERFLGRERSTYTQVNTVTGLPTTKWVSKLCYVQFVLFISLSKKDFQGEWSIEYL